MKNIFLVMCFMSTVEVMPSGVQMRGAVIRENTKQLLAIVLTVLESENGTTFRAWNHVNQRNGQLGGYISLCTREFEEVFRFDVAGMLNEDAATFCFSLNRLLAGLATGCSSFTRFKERDEQVLRKMCAFPAGKDLCVENVRRCLDQLKADQ